jgi:hypothetical protein
MGAVYPRVALGQALFELRRQGDLGELGDRVSYDSLLSLSRLTQSAVEWEVWRDFVPPENPFFACYGRLRRP